MKMLGLLKIYTIQKMDFNQIVKKKLMPILDKYDIHIVEDRRNYLKFQFVNGSLKI